MSNASMSQFLEGLSASRLLENERIEEVLRRPESPRGDVDGIARFLETSGWLTRFQIDEIRQGRAKFLLFTGYRLLEKLPDRPGGQAFKAHHPAFPEPVVVRWVEPGWLAPADDVRSFIARARSASAISHPNLVNMLDAGFAGDTAFLVYEFVEGASLAGLVAEMGALPVHLASDYARQAALALQAAHEKGVMHGDISPSQMLLAPVIRKPGVNGNGQSVVRPAPAAILRLDGLGQSPRRMVVSNGNPIAFLSPERISNNVPDVRGDLYGLGASLYSLLTARPPYTGPTAEVAEQIQRTTLPRLDMLRKDVSPALADLVQRLMAKDPASRPNSAAAVAQEIQYLGNTAVAIAQPVEATAYAAPLAAGTDTRPNTLPAVMASVAAPIAEPIHEPLVESLPPGTRDSQIYSPVMPRSDLPDDHHHADMFDHHHDDQSEPRPLKPREQVKGGWLWLVLGLCLHVGAVLTLVLWFFKMGPFAEEPNTPQENTKQEKIEKKKKK